MDWEVEEEEPVARGRCHHQGNLPPACTNKHYLHCADREPSGAEQPVGRLTGSYLHF